jgi:chromate transporter
MAASALILARSSDQSALATLLTVVAAVMAFATRLNPFWMLLAGGILGFAGLV